MRKKRSKTGNQSWYFLLTRQLICGGFLLISFSVIGQEKISGVVKDVNDQPLAAVTVQVEGTNIRSLTDMDGHFEINASPSQVIVFTSVGYQTKKIKANTNTVLTVILDAVSEELDEVVVTALGFETEKAKLGYATSKIGGTEVAGSGEATLVDGLGGKASGVKISRSSGDPGSSSQILIRGQSTITRSTDPLIILDGVPIDGGSRNQGAGSTAGGSRLNDINPDDIDNVQVLKGASAAALWGTRAANGVIMITTKKGSIGKTQINFISRYSVDKINAKYPMQTTYGQGLNGKWQNNAPRSWGDKIADRPGTPDEVDNTGAYFQSYNDGQIYYPITKKNSRETFVDKNWDQVYGNGHYFENNISLSGATDKSNYFFSLGNLDQDGIIRSSSSYGRTSLRLNASRTLEKWLKISNHAVYTRTTSDRIQRGVNTSGFTTALLRTSPDFDNSGYIGDYFAQAGGTAIPNRQRSYRNSIGASSNPGFNNPQWDIYELENTSLVNRFINSAEIDATPLNWLTIVARAGIDNLQEESKNFWPVNTATATGGSYARNNYSQTLLNMDFIVSGTYEFNENISGNLLIGYNYFSNFNTSLNGSALNLILPDGPKSLNNFASSTIQTTDNYERSRTNAAYSSAGLALWNQLFINGTIRAEAASSFGIQNKSRFFYPSTDIAWQFTKSLGIQDNSILNFGKLRAGFGIVGIQPSPYQTSNLFIVPTWNDQLLSYLSAGLFGNGTYVQSSSKNSLNLRPEKKREFEFGVDLRLFKNKVTTSMTYYQNKTIDALLSIPIPASTGFSSVYGNAGTIQNKGYEFDLSYQLINKSDWGLNLDLNWYKNDNKVTSLNGTTSFSLAGSGVAGASSAVEGYPLGELFGIGWQRDEDHNLLLDANGFPMADNVGKPLGDPNPNWRSGFGISGHYKNLTFSVLFEHSHGGVIMDATEAVLLDYGTSATTGNESIASADLKTSNGGTIPQGQAFRGNIYDFGGGNVALDQSWYTGLGGWFGNVYEQFIKDNTWTRLRTVSIGYNLLPRNKSEFLGMKSIKLEVSGRNLLLFSNIKGIDPDTNLNSNTSARGVTYFDNPGTKSFLVSLRLIF